MRCGKAGIVTALYKTAIAGEYGSYYYADLKAPSLSLYVQDLKALATVQGIFEIKDRGFSFYSKGGTTANLESHHSFSTPTKRFRCNPL